MSVCLAASQWIGTVSFEFNAEFKFQWNKWMCWLYASSSTLDASMEIVVQHILRSNVVRLFREILVYVFAHLFVLFSFSTWFGFHLTSVCRVSVSIMLWSCSLWPLFWYFALCTHFFHYYLRSYFIFILGLKMIWCLFWFLFHCCSFVPPRSSSSSIHLAFWWVRGAREFECMVKSPESHRTQNHFTYEQQSNQTIFYGNS